MPEKFYSFKANPEEMSFATLLIHIANSNRFRFAQVAEAKTPPPAAPKEWNKAVIVDWVRASFNYCIETPDPAGHVRPHRPSPRSSRSLHARQQREASGLSAVVPATNHNRFWARRPIGRDFVPYFQYVGEPKLGRCPTRSTIYRRSSAANDSELLV
jgi:hypothetical protein